MILQSLASYYEVLREKGELAEPGWAPAGISYGLEIGEDGQILRLYSLKISEERGKKTVVLPQKMMLPAAVKRSVGIASNFLWDNGAYILGLSGKNSERAFKCFEYCREYHHKLLDGIDAPEAKALLDYFDQRDPADVTAFSESPEMLEDVLGGANLVFLFRGKYIHEYPSLHEVWTESYLDEGEGDKYPCLISGKMSVPQRLHPAIKGVRGAQSSGASLVSFNAQAFESYDREQGMNAPTGSYGAFAYGAALNYLLAKQNMRIGDTTVLFWAESGEKAYEDVMSMFAFGEDEDRYSEADLSGMMESLVKGNAVRYEDTLLDPDMNFFILGLAPNAARLSVRFFLRNTFGEFVKNVNEHHRRAEIVRPAFDKFDTVPLWIMLNETVNQNARDKTPVPGMAGQTLSAVLNNTAYPATLINGVEMRIRADRTVNRARAAIIKAYYLQNKHPDVPEEVLRVALNKESTNLPYNLGRLFSLLETIQDAANPGINTTITDRYFSSASATPAVVFPTLINLAKKHMKKLSPAQGVYYEKQLTELMGKMDTDHYPTHLTLQQQGAFQLGYYHQTQARYEKKEEKE